MKTRLKPPRARPTSRQTTPDGVSRPPSPLPRARRPRASWSRPLDRPVNLDACRSRAPRCAPPGRRPPHGSAATARGSSPCPPRTWPGCRWSPGLCSQDRARGPRPRAHLPRCGLRGRSRPGRRHAALHLARAHAGAQADREARGGDSAGLAALASFDAVLLGGAATPAPVLAELRAAGVRVVTTYGMSETAGGCVYDGHRSTGSRSAPSTGACRSPAGLGRRLPRRPRGDRGRLRDRPPGNPSTGPGNRCGPRALSGAGQVPPGGSGRATSASWPPTGRSPCSDGPTTSSSAAVSTSPPQQSRPSSSASRGRRGLRGRLPDPEWGEDVVAVVTLALCGTDVSQDTLLAQARSHVTDILGAPAAPRHVVVTDALALRGPGKVDRRAVALLAARRLGRPTSTSDR